MADVDSPSSKRAPTVFLSYASGDREAARALRDALRTQGLEVWYDESELGGGEAWDQKIRKQIRECDYFMPVISAQTEARHEGYFRREWRLAVERTLDMADDHPYLLPVVLDETRQTGARVPEKFLSIQWVRAPGGQSNAALEALCRRLLSGEPATPPSQRTGSSPARAASVSAAASSEPPGAQYPEFPREGSASKTHYWTQVVVWALRSGWIFFKQLPRWMRLLISIWLSVMLISRGCSSNDYRSSRVAPPDPQQLRAITEKYHGSFDKSDISKLATQIAKLTADDAEVPAEKSPLLAIPFSAPPGNAEAAKMADSTFALVYGKVSIAHRGSVGLSKESAPCDDSKAALERGRANHSAYVLCGTIDVRAAAAATAPASVLSIKLAKVGDGSVLWSKSYPVAGADPSAIAAEVNDHVPALGND